MKNGFLGIAMICGLVTTSCKKEKQPEASEKIVMTGTMPNARLLSKTALDTPEYGRVLAALTGYDDYVLISCEMIYGQHSYRPSTDYGFTASDSAGDLRLWLDGERFSQNPGWSACFSSDSRLEKFFGKTVRVALAAGANAVTQDLYLPVPLAATGIYHAATAYSNTGRKGNTLKWIPDPDNPTEKIAIAYQLYHRNSNLTLAPLGEEHYLVVDDNGSFNLDRFITPEANSYEITFWRGNAMAFQNGSKKVLFAVASADEHLYFIRD